MLDSLHLRHNACLPLAGGAEKFLQEDMDQDYLPVWLQQLGYRTYFTGKFLNMLSQEMLQTR